MPDPVPCCQRPARRTLRAWNLAIATIVAGKHLRRGADGGRGPAVAALPLAMAPHHRRRRHCRRCRSTADSPPRSSRCRWAPPSPGSSPTPTSTACGRSRGPCSSTPVASTRAARTRSPSPPSAPSTTATTRTRTSTPYTGLDQRGRQRVPDHAGRPGAARARRAPVRHARPRPPPAPSTVTVRLANRAYSPARSASPSATPWCGSTPTRTTTRSPSAPASFDSGTFGSRWQLAAHVHHRREPSATSATSTPSMVGVVAVSAPSTDGHPAAARRRRRTAAPAPVPPPGCRRLDGRRRQRWHRRCCRRERGHLGGDGRLRVRAGDAHRRSGRHGHVDQQRPRPAHRGGRRRLVPQPRRALGPDLHPHVHHARHLHLHLRHPPRDDRHHRGRRVPAARSRRHPATPAAAPAPVTASGDVTHGRLQLRSALASPSPPASRSRSSTPARHATAPRPRTARSTRGSWPVANRPASTFNTPGTFPYFCTLHANMTGTILVTGRERRGAAAAQGCTDDRGGQAGDVQMVDFDFSPKQMTVAAGALGGLRQRRGGPAHGDGEGRVVGHRHGALPVDRAEITFPTPGTFSYYCTMHPKMVATMLVIGADGAAPPAEAAPAAPPGPPAEVDVKVLADDVRAGRRSGGAGRHGDVDHRQHEPAHHRRRRRRRS